MGGAVVDPFLPEEEAMAGMRLVQGLLSEVRSCMVSLMPGDVTTMMIAKMNITI